MDFCRKRTVKYAASQLLSVRGEGQTRHHITGMQNEEHSTGRYIPQSGYESVSGSHRGPIGTEGNRVNAMLKPVVTRAPGNAHVKVPNSHGSAGVPCCQEPRFT